MKYQWLIITFIVCATLLVGSSYVITTLQKRQFERDQYFYALDKKKQSDMTDCVESAKSRIEYLRGVFCNHLGMDSKNCSLPNEAYTVLEKEYKKTTSECSLLYK